MENVDMKKNIEIMNTIFTSAIKDRPVAILIHSYPDPDCMGAASGLAIILKQKYDLDCKIYHFGEISHPQNKSMKNVLHIPLENGNDFNPEKVSSVVVLDTDVLTAGFKDKAPKIDIRIDHHRLDRECELTLKDVRNVGATCSIVWDYLRAFGIDMKDHSDAATAMVLGILTDTLDFTSQNTSDLDVEAFRSLIPHANKELLSKVIKYSLPKILFKVEIDAFNAKEIKNSTLVTFVGEQSAHNRDIIATISDRFVRMVGVNTVFILGIVENELYVSVRSSDSRVDVGEVCAKVFGKEFSGAKEGGGSGGARVPLKNTFEFITDLTVREKVIEEVFATFKTRIFSTLGEEEVAENQGEEE